MTISEQDYFDLTIGHLYRQRVRAVHPNGACAYRGPNGTMCAVGRHVPDEHPATQSKGGVSTLRVQYPDLAGIAWPNTEQGLWLAATLQMLHDDAANWGESGFIGWPLARQVARRYRLDVSFVDALELEARTDG